VNRFVAILLVVDAGLVATFVVWHAPWVRWLGFAGFALLAVLVLVDTVLERRRV
jgi:hypothetical protein